MTYYIPPFLRKNKHLYLHHPFKTVLMLSEHIQKVYASTLLKVYIKNIKIVDRYQRSCYEK